MNIFEKRKKQIYNLLSIRDDEELPTVLFIQTITSKTLNLLDENIDIEMSEDQFNETVCTSSLFRRRISKFLSGRVIIYLHFEKKEGLGQIAERYISLLRKSSYVVSFCIHPGFHFMRLQRTLFAIFSSCTFETKKFILYHGTFVKTLDSLPELLRRINISLTSTFRQQENKVYGQFQLKVKKNVKFTNNFPEQIYARHNQAEQHATQRRLPVRLYGYFAWESTLLPEYFQRQANLFNHLLVPSNFVKSVFRRSGVTCPLITVVPHIFKTRSVLRSFKDNVHRFARVFQDGTVLQEGYGNYVTTTGVINNLDANRAAEEYAVFLRENMLKMKSKRTKYFFHDVLKSGPFRSKYHEENTYQRNVPYPRQLNLHGNHFQQHQQQHRVFENSRPLCPNIIFYTINNSEDPRKNFLMTCLWTLEYMESWISYLFNLSKNGNLPTVQLLHGKEREYHLENINIHKLETPEFRMRFIIKGREGPVFTFLRTMLNGKFSRCRPYVEMIDDSKHLSDDEIKNIHKQGHIFVNATHGEGVGMSIIDAVLHGNIVIVPRFSGYLDYIGFRYPYYVDSVVHDVCTRQEEETETIFQRATMQGVSRCFERGPFRSPQQWAFCHKSDFINTIKRAVTDLRENTENTVRELEVSRDLVMNFISPLIIQEKLLQVFN